MGNLSTRLIGIFLLRFGPQDLPSSGGLLALLIAAYMILTLITIHLGSMDFEPVPLVLLSVVLALGLSWIVLRLAGKTARWVQTITALFGAAVIFRLLNMPLVMVGDNGAPALLEIFALMLFFWSFAVDGHIYRHALELTLSMGIAVAVVLFAVSYFVLFSMVGSL